MSGDRQLPFVGRSVPPWADVRVITIECGEHLVYDREDWLDSIVAVDSGVVVLVGLSGRCAWVERGDILWLVDQPLGSIRNDGGQPAVLLAVSRRH